MLSSKIAQSIVDRTMKILEVQVNIMDANAVIIASGNPKRIGKFHAGAEKVLKTGKKLIISNGEAQRMEGVRPGITLPIEFKGKIIGAVGMQGDSEKAEAFGEVLKLTAELMLEQASIKEEIYLEQRARESLFTDLLTGHWREYEWHFLRRAELLNFELEKTYLVMSAKFFAPEDHSPLKNQSEEELSYQRRIQLEGRLAGTQLLGGRLICCFVGDEIALLYQTPERGETGSNEFISRIAAAVQEILNQNGGRRPVVAVGGVAQDWKEICKVYGDAKNVMQFSRLFQAEETICYYQDYRMEHMLAAVPKEVRRDFWHGILDPILKRDMEHRIQCLSTMQTYFKNELNTVQTAEQLFLHRNTLLFRLTKIREATGLAPQRFHDAIQLDIALLLMKMDEAEMDGEERTR